MLNNNHLKQVAPIARSFNKLLKKDFLSGNHQKRRAFSNRWPHLSISYIWPFHMFIRKSLRVPFNYIIIFNFAFINFLYILNIHILKNSWLKTYLFLIIFIYIFILDVDLNKYNWSSKSICNPLKTRFRCGLTFSKQHHLILKKP